MRFTTMAAAVAVLALGAGVALAACGSDDEETVDGQFELVADAPSGYEGLNGEATLERSGEGTEASLELSGLEPDTEYVAHIHAAGCDQADPGGPHYQFDPEGSDMPPNEIHLPFSSNADGEGEAEASNDREIPDGDAGSIVVHSTGEDGEAMAADGEAMKDGEAMEDDGGHSHSDKIACAELEGGTAPAETEPASDAMTHEGDKAMKDSVATIVIRNGKPAGGVRELRYKAGNEVHFEVRSDVADEVHVHGYDLTKDVAAGGTVAFSFPADLEGIFEVELEERVEQIAELRVEP